MNSWQGRGAPEMDILEAMPGNAPLPPSKVNRVWGQVGAELHCWCVEYTSKSLKERTRKGGNAQRESVPSKVSLFRSAPYFA